MSKYKVEIKKLKAEIKRLRTELGQCNTELNSALEKLKSQCCEIGELGAENRQAQIDVLNKVKDLMDKYYVFEGVCGYFIDDFKELIKEIEK